jgi:hypothetical protein
MTDPEAGLAAIIYETQERLRADDDIPGSPWTPWDQQTSRRERRIAQAMAGAALSYVRDVLLTRERVIGAISRRCHDTLVSEANYLHQDLADAIRALLGGPEK